MSTKDKMIQMHIKTLLIDPITRMPIIVLRDEKNKNILPIWVGIFEANAIAMHVEKIASPRPMTHDLLKNLLETLETSVKRIEINNLKNNTYYADIVLDYDGKEITIDSRPSDAIALSLRTSSPIFVEQKVLSKASERRELDDASEIDREELKRWFDSLSPDLLNKYKM